MKKKTPYVAAMPVAQRLAQDLETVCARVEIAGSLRRRRPTIGDIEIVVKPELVMGGLFGDEREALIEPVRTVLRGYGTLRRCGARYIEVLDVDGSGIKADVFLVHAPAEWGTILAIRTGPAELGQRAVTRMRRLSRRCVDGHVETEDGQRIPTPTEEDFFRAAGLGFFPPDERDDPKARQPATPVEVGR